MASEGGFRRTALGWLGDGLAHEIEEIARGIEAALAAEEPVQVAEALAQRLHGVVGTLRLVELDGAVALGEELEQVLQGLPRRPTEAQRDVAELLVRGLLRLRALLDRARSGDSEPPAALVRTINDLRAARGAEPLPLESFFRPDLTRPVPAEALPPHREGDAGAVALRARPVVQRALLGWMRGGDGNALRAFVGALDQVLARVAAPPLQLLLAAIAAVAEGAATGALAGDEPAARLLGNADRCLRDLTRRPEPEVAAAVPEGVLRRLLYAVARARPATPRIRALQSAYDLTALVGSEEPAAELNLELLERVAEGLREELAVARDLLDAAGGDDAEARIAEAAQAMGRIADILRVVGLEEGVARLEAAVARLGDTGSAPQADGEAMMLAATALVEVEALLDSMAHGRERPAGGAVGEARRHVLEEVLQELALARDALTALLSRPQEGALVDAAGRHFGQAALLLRVLDLEQGAQAVEAVAAAVAAGFLGALRGGREAELERLAEGVTALELYAEGLRDGRSDADELLARAHAVLGAPGPEAAEPEAAEAEVAEAEVAEPEVAEPEVAEPEVAEPEVAEPEVAEPEVAEPEVAEPEVAEPEVAEPEVAEAEVAEPEVAEPEVAEAEVAEAEVAEPETVEPETAGRAPSPLDGLAVLAEGADPEIVEIFVEEAGEVLGEAREALARLRRDDTDGEALLSLRRAFHTLKGSGRMAGAQRMGEFAWQLERLLNGVRDGLYPATPAVVAAAAEALDLVPEMIREIRQRRPLAAGAERLAARAAALVEGRGRLPATVQASDRGGAEAAAADDAGAAAEAGPEPREVPARAEVEDEQTLMGAAMDPVLYQVFRQEAEGHLDVVSAFLEEAARGGMAAAPSDGLLRALHTLHGSARMAGVAPVAEVAGALEAYGKALRANQAVFPEEALTVLAEAVEAMRAAVDGLARGGAALPDVDGLVRRITVFENKERTSQVLRLEGLELPPEEDASSRRAVLEVFLDEAMELVQALEATLHQWSEQPAETRFAVELARDLRSLGEAAGLAGVAPMAALCRAMKGLLERAGGAGEAPDPALWGLLAEGIEALEAMTSAVQAGQDPEPQAELVARLEAFGGAPGAEGGPGDAAAGATEEAAEAAVPAQDAAGEGPPCPADDRGGETGARASAAVWDESTLILEVGEGAAAAEEAAEADDEAALLREVFLEEASEILGRAEEAMVGWRARPQDPEPAAQLRRELHTLKGGARMAGIAAVAELCHAAESLLDDLATRRGEEAPVREVLQEALDALAGMVETVWRGGSPAPAPDLLERVGRLHAAVRGEAETAPVEGAASGAPAQPAAAERQDAGAEEPAAKAEVGEGAAGPEPGADAGPDRPASGDEGAAAGGGVAVTATVGAERRQPVLPAYQGHDTVRVRATLIDELVGFAGEIGLYRARLVQQANALRAALGEMEATVGRLREQLRKLEIETEAQILYRYEREGGPGREDFDPLELDRFSTLQQLSRALAESTEDLVNLRGILDGLNREAETMLVQQGRVASALQEGLMRARMVPFAGLLPRMRRIVRQVAQELGRKADLRVAGAEVELDTTVIDRVVPALEHLLRNALAHGIEPPERRREAGKPETGVVSISLSRDGPDVVIRIADDGAGVDLEAVRRKAEALGLLPPGAQIPEADLAQLILESGLSTAQEVTQVSGRGVGMDVVVNQVRQLGGTFAIETVRGRGTAFTLRIPFTLAVNRALLLRAGDETYAVLLSGVVGIARMGAEELAPFVSGEREEFVYAGRGYRFHHLGSLVDGAGVAVPEGGAKLPVILVRAAQQQVALLVDAVLGAREVVVKSLGPQFHGVRGVLGATILADGEVVLIVDVAALVHRGAILRAREAAAQEVDERPVVYVVDDSITMRRVTGRLLERHGMRAVAARDGVEALARMRELHPDLVLLDIEMPRMDGYDVAAHMRADPGLATVPIVMVTSRTGDKHRQRALELGVDRYLGKPYQEAELLETVRELLEGRAPAADAGGGA